VKWRLVVTPKVQTTLRVLPPQTKRYVREALEELRKDPWSGKPLRDQLAGLFSLRTRRFRIVYRIERNLVTVIVVGFGHRKTIYEELTEEIPRPMQ